VSILRGKRIRKVERPVYGSRELNAERKVAAVHGLLIIPHFLRCVRSHHVSVIRELLDHSGPQSRTLTPCVLARTVVSFIHLPRGFRFSVFLGVNDPLLSKGCHDILMLVKALKECVQRPIQQKIIVVEENNEVALGFLKKLIYVLCLTERGIIFPIPYRRAVLYMPVYNPSSRVVGRVVPNYNLK
jgi:hypothetical protein